MNGKEKLINKILFGKYKIKDLLGLGSFGDVYSATNIKTNKQYAVKIESKSAPAQLLEKETYLLYILKGPGIPKVITYGHSGNNNVLVEQLLGENLKSLFKLNNHNIKDLCMVTIQILERIEYVHSKNLIHRDIKPENFLVGNPDKSTIYLIDFGLSKKYRSSRTGKHVVYSICDSIPCTLQYASINTSKRIEQTRRDDLESLVYTLIYLANSELPWSRIKGKNKYECLLKSLKVKMNISSEELCKGLPKSYAAFTDYVKNLKFDETPNYNYLKSLFIDSLEEMGEQNDEAFSWIDPKYLAYLKRNRSNKPLRCGSSRRVRLIKRMEELVLNDQNEAKKSYSQNKIERVNITKKNENRLNNCGKNVLFESVKFENEFTRNINQKIFKKQSTINIPEPQIYKTQNNTETITYSTQDKTLETKKMPQKSKRLYDNFSNINEGKQCSNDFLCNINFNIENNRNNTLINTFFYTKRFNNKINTQKKLLHNKMYCPLKERLKIQTEYDNSKNNYTNNFNNEDFDVESNNINQIYSTRNRTQNNTGKNSIVNKTLIKKRNEKQLELDEKLINNNSLGQINPIFFMAKTDINRFIDKAIDYSPY